MLYMSKNSGGHVLPTAMLNTLFVNCLAYVLPKFIHTAFSCIKSIPSGSANALNLSHALDAFTFARECDPGE